jgi:integrase
MVRVFDDSKTRPKMLLDPYEPEVKLLENIARDADWAREIAVQLMARCGLRADEVTYPTPARLRWSSSGECWLLEVQGKDTSGGDGKTRDAWVPDKVAENIQRFASERPRSEDEPLINVHTSSVRRWVNEAGEEIADEHTSERWRKVSSHDLRRSWATYHLVEEGVDVRTMMSVGGWSNYSAIEPYLGKPTEAKIGSALGE